MPVEIKELIVKTTIDNSKNTQSNSQTSGTINIKNIKNIKNEIIDECVYKIMEQLKKNNER